MLRLILSAAVLISAVTPAPQKWPGQDGLSKTEQVLLFEPLVGLDRVWDTFKTEHGKVYAHSAEEMVRRQIFADNLKHIEMHNYLYSKGLKSYMLGVNEYSDMNHSEFIQKMTGLKVPQTPRTASTYFSPNVDFTLPTSIDWRGKGYVTPVKNQGGCGSCWTFSTTGAVEGQNFRKTGKLVSLSEQNLVDCVTEKYESHGCEGGNMRGAMHFIKDNGGIDTEESYPYEGKEGECRYNATNIGATVTGYVEVPQKESKLTEALATIGPISIGIDANHKSFMHYKSGVFNEPECTNQLNHGVLAIGYGTLNGDDYYIVKNSWGLTWGEKGYVKMSRNKKNQCGISLFASYPLV